MAIEFVRDQEGRAVSVMVPIHEWDVLLQEDLQGLQERRRLARIQKNQAAIALLDDALNCSEEEAQEQRAAWAFLKKAIDEDRLSDRKLYDDYPA